MEKGYSAALYMRLSKEGGGDRGGIESQRLLLRSFAQREGYCVFGEYIDDGYSGTNYERPAFLRLKEDIEKGYVNMVITKDMSRLGRNYIATGELTEEYFPSKNVRFIAINDGYDSIMGDDDISPFRHVINELYARDISRKIRSALYAKMREGQYIGSFAPFGYKKDADNKNHLVVDYDAGEIVKEIFKMSLERDTPSVIAEKLNKREIPVPLDYRNKMSGKPSENRRWTASGVCKILSNQVYLGYTLQRKSEKPSFRRGGSVARDREEWIVVKNTHEALVSEADFYAVAMERRGKHRRA